MDSMRAMEQVNHSQQVEAQSYALTYDLRNVEAAALAIAAGVDAHELPDRIEQSRERIAPALDTLQALTRDNPDQQVRIGVVRTTVKLRMDEVDRSEERSGGKGGVRTGRYRWGRFTLK